MEAGTRKLITLLPTVVLVALTAALSAVASAQTAASGSPGPAMHESKSMGNVAKQLNNPVADLWALNFQFNRYYLQGEATDRTREQDVMNFQPVLPVHLTSEWNLITRPVFPYIFSSPDFEPGEGWDEKSGFGDMALVSLLSPAKLTGGFIWGGWARHFSFPRPRTTLWARANTRPALLRWGSTWGRNGCSGHWASSGGPSPATTTANPTARPTSSTSSSTSSATTGRKELA